MTEKHCALITFKRKKEFIITDSGIEIICDGSVLDTIEAGQNKTFEILPGLHELWLRLDIISSRRIETQVLAGEKYQFLCSTNWSGLMFPIYYLIYRRALLLKKL